MSITATLSEKDVLDHVASEIDSIAIDVDDSKEVSYEPEAFTREGQVD